ncbi:MAG: YqaE/Pmp3 family membrane protein [Myxococcota bacterium]
MFSYFLPPVGVFLTRGFGGALGVNVLLTMLGYVPGILHAVWQVATDVDEDRG